LYVDVIVDVYECEVDFGITDQLLNRYFISVRCWRKMGIHWNSPTAKSVWESMWL